MASKIASLYEESGYPSKTEFKKIAAAAGFTASEINDFINRTSALQIYDRPTRLAGTTAPHYSHNSYRWAFMIDLMDTSKYSRHNQGIHWLLNIVEWHSRKVWSIPLKTKAAEPIEKAVSEILEKLPNWHVEPIRIISDQGTEFSLLRKWVGLHPNIQWLYTTATRKSTRPVERFNRTVWTAFARYWARDRASSSRGMLPGQQFHYLDFLPIFVVKYKKPHSTTGLIPDVAFEKGHDPVIDLTQNIPQPFNIGDHVRYLELRALFDKKSATPVWSSTVHAVEKVSGDRYSLAGVPGTKLASELKKATAEDEDEPIDNIAEEDGVYDEEEPINKSHRKLTKERSTARKLKDIHTRSDFKVGIADPNAGRKNGRSTRLAEKKKKNG